MHVVGRVKKSGTEPKCTFMTITKTQSFHPQLQMNVKIIN